ncbi:MAG: aminoacyl-histidine dipeptidase [Rikenellaceae bacterium]|nr:aminoacyl-histidine dipeptidase [Rikenellaceae bacterium]
MKLTDLKPEAVWRHFEAITHIPRPSHSEEKIRQYIVDFAKAQGLEYIVDEGNNVMIRKPATPGMENREGAVLQAHLDMVPQKNNDKVFDFEKDGIEAYVDGEWVTANGTTLGADNGIGVAAVLAVLESTDLVHGPIEGLFTATEETGMDGAFGLREGMLQGRTLLNLDSEAEGELYVGCAGGIDANITLKYQTMPTPAASKAYTVEVKGLKGGHSGIEIILNRANANKLMFRLLREAQMSLSLEIASVDGGGLRNAIPREAVAVVTVPSANAEALEALAAEYLAMYKEEFKGVDDDITLTLTPTQTPAEVMATESAVTLARAIMACPNGVIDMSRAMENLVQTSTNFARVVTDGSCVVMQALTRSSMRSEKMWVAEMIRSTFELAGAEVELTGSYEGWNPNMASPILHTMSENYEKLYGVKPRIMAIHAGLECGIIGGKYPGMDMISFGPTICYPHSPDEKVNIASVAKFWEFLCATLANMPLK